MKIPWYKEVITKHKKKAVISAIFLLCLALTYSIWRFGFGQSFEWVEITVISQPSIFNRLLYSALTFVSLGAVLYRLGFYQALHRFFVGMLRDWGLYKDVKNLVWWVLIGLMYSVIVPFVVDLINFIATIGYNIFNLILYLSPPVGIVLSLTLLAIVIKKNLYAKLSTV